MRTTLTIDDDLAGILHQKASQQGHSFKEVVNDMLRAGLAIEGIAAIKREPLKVISKPLGLRAGYDPDKLNQLIDELDVEGFVRKQDAP